MARSPISRWDNPIWYDCAHEDCQVKARVLVRKEQHTFPDRRGVLTTKAHNCCCGH